MATPFPLARSVSISEPATVLPAVGTSATWAMGCVCGVTPPTSFRSFSSSPAPRPHATIVNPANSRKALRIISFLLVSCGEGCGRLCNACATLRARQWTSARAGEARSCSHRARGCRDLQVQRVRQVRRATGCRSRGPMPLRSRRPATNALGGAPDAEDAGTGSPLEPMEAGTHPFRRRKPPVRKTASVAPAGECRRLRDVRLDRRLVSKLPVRGPVRLFQEWHP